MMKHVTIRQLLISLLVFILVLTACSRQITISHPNLENILLDDTILIDLNEQNIDDEISEILITLDNQKINIDYFVKGMKLEIISSQRLQPQTTYHMEIILNSGEHHVFEIETISEIAQLDIDIENTFFIMPTVGDYDLKEANIMKERILTISPNILRALFKAGVKMKFANGPITDEPELQYLKGVVPRGWEGLGMTWDDVPGAGGYDLPIARIGYSEPSAENNHGSINLELHEIAHTVDNYISGEWSEQAASNTEEFIEIWKKEAADVLPDIYFVSYPEEYFAEIFAMYYLNAESRLRLVERAPLSFDYIENLDSYITLNN